MHCIKKSNIDFFGKQESYNFGGDVPSEYIGITGLKMMTKNLWLAALFFALVTSGVAQGAPPNVLLIVADDMGYSDIGPFGGEIATPT